MTKLSAGRVGRSHGRNGSFWVEGAQHPLEEGTELSVAGKSRRVERRAGTDARPLVRLSGLDDPRPLRGETLLVEDELAEDEWLADDLVGCQVQGLGRVRRVVEAPSCDVLELEDGTLVPLVSDAIRSIDTGAGTIEVHRAFLDLS